MDIVITGKAGEDKRNFAEKIVKLHVAHPSIPIVDNDAVYTYGRKLLDLNYKDALARLIEAKPKEAIIFDDIWTGGTMRRAQSLINDYRLATGHNPLCIYILIGNGAG